MDIIETELLLVCLSPVISSTYLLLFGQLGFSLFSVETFQIWMEVMLALYSIAAVFYAVGFFSKVSCFSQANNRAITLTNLTANSIALILREILYYFIISITTGSWLSDKSSPLLIEILAKECVSLQILIFYLLELKFLVKIRICSIVSWWAFSECVNYYAPQGTSFVIADIVSLADDDDNMDDWENGNEAENVADDWIRPRPLMRRG